MRQRRHDLVRQASDTPVSWNAVLNVIIILLACFVLLPQLDRFSTSLDALGSANIWLVAGAFVSGMSTLLFAALTYRLLAGNRVNYARTLAVQIAGTFTNRLLPAGIGGLGINIRFLMKAHVPAAAAAAIAATNNLLGFFGHSTLMVLAFLLSDLAVSELFEADVPPAAVIGLIVAVVLAVGILLAAKRLRQKTARSLRQAVSQLLSYRNRPHALMAGYVSSLMVTILYALCFYICLQAVGIDLSVPQAFVALSLGIAAGAVTPTPGGLVGVEAGMFAGLIGFNAQEAAALSAVLLYRLVTYWAPIIPGVIMFRYLRRKRII